MRAVVLDYAQHTLTDRHVEEPREVSAGQVLMRIHSCGVCGTDRDLASFQFSEPPPGEPYMILGHEAVAEVVECGAGVSGLQRGDYVVPTVRRPCNPPCAACAAGRRDLCTSGAYTERGILRQHGYFTEYAVDDAADVIPIPRGREEYGMLIEPLSCVEKAVDSAIRVHVFEPRTALVIGAGTVGILAALVLTQRGLATTIQSIEPPLSARARLVEPAGIPFTNRYSGAGADIVFEAAGCDEAVYAGVGALAPNGVLVVFGAKEGRRGFPFLELILKNQTVLGSINASPAGAWQAARDLATFDAGILDAMIHRVRFDDYRESILGSAPERPKTVHVIS